MVGEPWEEVALVAVTKEECLSFDGAGGVDVAGDVLVMSGLELLVGIGGNLAGVAIAVALFQDFAWDGLKGGAFAIAFNLQSK